MSNRTGRTNEETQTQVRFELCGCGSPDPHGRIRKGRKKSEAFEKKAKALAFTDGLFATGQIDSTEAEALKAQINASTLADPLPDALIEPDGSTSFVPLRHMSLRIDEEPNLVFSKAGAHGLVERLAKKDKVNAETAARITAEIDASNLPATSDIDTLMLAMFDNAEEERAKREADPIGSMIEELLGGHVSVVPLDIPKPVGQA